MQLLTRARRSPIPWYETITAPVTSSIEEAAINDHFALAAICVATEELVLLPKNYLNALLLYSSMSLRLTQASQNSSNMKATQLIALISCIKVGHIFTSL